MKAEMRKRNLMKSVNSVVSGGEGGLGKEKGKRTYIATIETEKAAVSNLHAVFNFGKWSTP